MNYDVIRQVLREFESEGVRYVVCGGAAMNLHGIARFTEDLDVFIAPEAGNIEKVKAALNRVFHDPEIDSIRSDELLGDYPAVQYVPPDGEFHIDLLTRLGDAFRFDDLETVRLPIGDLTVTVASPRMLYRMKRDTVRLRDKADAEMLRLRFGLGEE
ncbi:MAG: nucleotidyl transferase AbiEii/AbiGii toxin family protein [Thermoanaerobaculia bacterium]